MTTRHDTDLDAKLDSLRDRLTALEQARYRRQAVADNIIVMAVSAIAISTVVCVLAWLVYP